MVTQRKSAVWCLFVVLVLALSAVSAVAKDGKTKVGKNPGQIKGRWLEIDVAAAKAAKGVYLGTIESDIQWRKAEKESPMDEDLLNEKIKIHLLENLRASGLFAQVLESAPKNTSGFLRLDCDLKVDPGNRAVRYVAGFGAGKSKSIFEVHIRDAKSGQEVGLYHGFGTGTGMGLKIGGGGARKMTEDDIQENSKKFAELLQQVL